MTLAAKTLESAGFVIMEFGDGGAESDYNVPHVLCRISPMMLIPETQRMVAVLQASGFIVGNSDVQSSYDPTDHTAMAIFLEKHLLRRAAPTEDNGLS